MGDTYGALSIDVALAADGEACGDPALSIVADYLKAVINSKATTAWRSISPPSNPVKTGKDYPCNSAFPYDPYTAGFSSEVLPSLFLFRSQGGPFEDQALDIRIATGTWTLWWIYRETTDAKRALRFPFANAIAKIIDDALERERDHAYVRTGDTDVLAPSIAADTDSVKLSVATATSPQMFTGGALDGFVGATVMDPPRSPTIILAGPDGSFIAGATYTIVGLNTIDQSVTLSLVTNGPGTYDVNYDLKQVTSITAPAQADALGTQQFGTAGRAGLGTDIYAAAGLWQLRAGRQTPKLINIQIQNSDPRAYDALEMLIEVQERREVDIAQFALLDDGSGSAGINAGVEMTLLTDEDDVASTAFYD